MRQSDTSTEISCPASIEATASPIQGGRAYMTDMARRLAPDVARSQSRDRVLASRRGWLSEAERKHSWQVAEVCGAPTPYGFQYVLSRADWDANAVRDERHTSILQHLGDANGVLVLDETGLLKQGQHSAGVARQDPGTGGTGASGQMGVFLSDASRLGHARVDRELSVPAAWAHHRERCRQAGIRGDQPVATTPQLACQMLARAFAAGLPATWGTGDRVYGGDRRLRRWLEARPQASVLAVSGQAYGWCGPPQRQVNTLLARLPAAGWTRLSAGDGAKGPRWYDWRWQPLAPPLVPGWGRWLLVRRSLSAPTDLTA